MLFLSKISMWYGSRGKVAPFWHSHLPTLTLSPAFVSPLRNSFSAKFHPGYLISHRLNSSPPLSLSSCMRILWPTSQISTNHEAGQGAFGGSYPQTLVEVTCWIRVLLLYSSLHEAGEAAPGPCTDTPVRSARIHSGNPP